MPVVNERTSVTIGASTYWIRRFDAFTALEVLGNLQQKFLGPLLPALDAADGDKEAMMAAGMSGFARLSASLSGAELKALAKQLINPECISVAVGSADENATVKLDAVQQLRAFESATDIIELCVAVVRVNFSDALARAGALLGAASSSAGAAGFLRAAND